MLYLKSEENKGSRTGKSTSASDEVIAKAIQRKLEFGDKTGVLMHYQYGAGKVQYLRPYERELDSTFTPFYCRILSTVITLKWMAKRSTQSH